MQKEFILSLTIGVALVLANIPSGAAAPGNATSNAQIRQDLAGIKLPPGFSISLYARVADARSIAVDPHGGTVYVGTRDGVVWKIPPVNHGGPGSLSKTATIAEAANPADPNGANVTNVAADAGGPLAVGVSFLPSQGWRDPNGVCFSPDGTLFIADRNRIVAVPNPDNSAPQMHDVIAQGQLIPTALAATNHGAHVCRVGPDGRLYVTIGQRYDVTPPDQLQTFYDAGMGAIISMNTDGSGRQVYARGIRNSVGLDFNPRDRTLWFTDNQTDHLGEDKPPGELNHATGPGQNFGYPYYGGGHDRTVEYQDKTPPAGVVFPEVEMLAHAADLGMSFYTGQRFPAKYRGGIFSAQHGSWARSVPVGARIMYTPVGRDGHATGSEVFAAGWIAPDGTYKGRPVDVEPMPDGSLLVSDDYVGALYRITYSAAAGTGS
jgi:glucose/arabinose dehydrogenase